MTERAEMPEVRLSAMPCRPKTPTCHSSFVMITSGEEPIIRQTIPDPPRPKQVRTITRLVDARRLVPALERLPLRKEFPPESVLPMRPTPSIGIPVVDERAWTIP